MTSLDEYERMLEITSADTVILLVGRKDRRGRGARMLLALNEMRLKMGKATILLAHGAEKDHKAVLPAYKPRFYRRQRREAAFRRLPFAPVAHAPGWPPFPLPPYP